MKLVESKKADGSHYSWHFYCPGCHSRHQVDARWECDENLESPTIGGSVLVHGIADIGRPRCHSNVASGKITFHADSTHALAGQTVDLPDVPEGSSL